MYKHGDHNTRLYRTHQSMKQRCYNKKCDIYPYYGGRGIKVCDSWIDSYIEFKNWAMSNGYREDLTIDREDFNGDYTPDNCRWATKTTQARNTRCIGSNNTSGYRGVSWNTKEQKYYVFITINHTAKYLGCYNDPLEGAKAYDRFIINNKLEHTINDVLTDEDDLNLSYMKIVQMDFTQPILKLDLHNNIIMEYNNLNELLNIDKSLHPKGIRAHIRHKKNMYKGFRYRFKEEYKIIKEGI